MGGSISKAREQEEIDQLLESALCGGEKPEWANEDSLRSPKELSDSLKAAGVESVVFDRNGYLYHGRVKSLADAAREGGLQF